ncbi:sensor histidine kinase [Paenibacillus chartarius]|uniref:histidine kinase n=1 Tax=Paenibacillus chartarius TaxID=747481 RepID=A0ABV6DHN9_9BACL
MMIRLLNERMKSLRFRTKIFLSNFIIIVFVALTIGGFAVYVSSQYIVSNARDMSKQVIHQVAGNIDNRAKGLFNTSVYIITDPVIRQILGENTVTVTPDNYPVFRSRMEFLLEPHGNGNPYIKSILIQSRSGYIYGWGRMESAGKGLDEAAAQQTIEMGKAYLSEIGGNLGWTSSEGDIVLLRHFINIDRVSESLGLLMIRVDPRYFRSIDVNSSMMQWENIEVMNSRGDVLIGGGHPVSSEMMAGRLWGGDPTTASSRIVRDANTSYLLTAAVSGDLGWRVLCYIPMSKLQATTRLLGLVIALVCLAAILISTGIAALLSKSTAKSIKKLEQTMRKVEEGDFSVRVVPMGRDEVGMLSVRFNYMVHRINELINSAYKERIAKQQAEFKALLAQINPHFLYNTLGTIRWYSHMKGQPDIEQMVSSLIQLLKTSVRREGELHLLEQELANIASYIHLQKIGYGDAFRVDYRIDETLLNGYVPFLTLQPLVENAILHGLEMSKGNGLIEISARREGNELLLVVKDNGVGMDESVISDILHREQRGTSPQGLYSIGVRSIHERIQLYFGECYGLRYNSKPGEGTEAIVRLPYMTELEAMRRAVSGHDRGG